MIQKLLFLAAATGLAAGCGGGDDEAVPADDAAPAAAPAAEETPGDDESPPALIQSPTGDTAAPTATAPPRPQPAAAVRVDQPFVTADTGTVTPGMTEADVIGVWGEPAQRRAEGIYTFLFFRNGCEASCGMYDLVILEADQVVDAIVRFPGHRYDGVSSSPPGSEGVSTPPTMGRLNMSAGS